MSVLLAIFFGIIQGITEFIPVSDSGHLAVLKDLFKGTYAEGNHYLFDALLRLAALLVICYVYWEDVSKMAKGGVRLLKGEMDFSVFGDPLMAPSRQLVLILIGSIPMLLVVIFGSKLRLICSRTGFIGFALMVNGLILFASDKLVVSGKKGMKKITIGDAVLIGLAQLCSWLPGISRTGSTITVGMSRGLSRSYATRFSLLLSLPSLIIGFFIYLFRAILDGIIWSSFIAYFIGFIFAVIFGLAALIILQRIMHRGRFGKLAPYCWIIGGIILLLSIVL